MLVQKARTKQDMNCVVPENIHTTPTEGIPFSRGEGGVNLPNFLVGVLQSEIFPEGSCDAEERNKEKTQKFTTTIYLRRIRINEHSEDILSVPWSDPSRETFLKGLAFSNG